MKKGNIVLRNPDVAGREMSDGEGVLLLNRKTGGYHRLNATGALIWEALAEPATVDELERRLRNRWRDAPVDLAADLATYVEDLADRDLVRFERGASPSV